jgi:hypothetical protein
MIRAKGKGHTDQKTSNHCSEKSVRKQVTSVLSLLLPNGTSLVLQDNEYQATSSVGSRYFLVNI